MKQILQNLRSGVIEIADVPCPAVRPGHLLIQSTASLISAGTERMLVEFSRGSLLAKARAQPEKVKQVLAKIKTDGLLPTLEAVFSRLDEPLPLGYCNVGRVVEVGRDVQGFAVGDRVVSNGPHAEMVVVPATLCARIPENVSDEAASFTVLGAISLHGVRLMQPTFGETFAVVGLGLLGILAAQILRAHGCNVLGIDVNPARCELARKFGCEAVAVSEGADPVAAAEAISAGRGVDGVLITASAKSEEIMHQAALMCRKRGRIVLVGVVPLNLARSDFYEKELTFQVSCSYGPGRYDPQYEGQNRDYPFAYVRWTVARNFEALLNGMAQGWLNVTPLITRRVAQGEAAGAYDAILKDGSVLGVVLTYPEQAAPMGRAIVLSSNGQAMRSAAKPRVAVIGAGNFTKMALLPALKAAGADIRAIASAGGVSSLHTARRFEADEASTDYRKLLESSEIDAVFITTRHNSHPYMAAEALNAAKHVFLEKPLAIDEVGLAHVAAAHAARPDRQLFVGFNRRFAPHTVEARKRLRGRSQPVAITMTVNAGAIPANHWTHDPESGGGRMIGEGCHFIDLLLFLVGSPITHVYADMFGRDRGATPDDKMTVNLAFADGSIGTVHYLANGPKSYPKERVEIFSEGRVLVIDNWRRLVAYEWRGVPTMRMRQDKGHNAEVSAFLNAVAAGGAQLIPFVELEMVTRATFAAVRSARDGVRVALANVAGDKPAETPAG